MRIWLAGMAVLTLIAGAQPAAAQGNPEDIDVKITVRARDGSVIGTPMGGAHVMIRDRRNGDILAEGITAGASGDAATIMGKGFARDAVIAADDTGRFEFSLAVLEPTAVTISARAPLSPEQAAVTVTEDMILIPGKDYSTGNGIMLTVPGFAVSIAEPAPNTRLKHKPDEVIPLRVNVSTLAGDRPSDKGFWNADRYQVEAHIFRDSAFVMSMPLVYGKKDGLFAANMKIPVAGAYRIVASVYDPQTKESGIHTTTLTLE